MGYIRNGGSLVGVLGATMSNWVEGWKRESRIQGKEYGEVLTLYKVRHPSYRELTEQRERKGFFLA